MARVLICAFWIFAAAISAWSLPVQPLPQGDAGMSALRDEVKNYARREILPSLREWKKTLDDAMKSEDLSALNQLRKEAAQLRSSTREISQEMRQAWKKEDYAALKSARSRMDGLKSSRTELLAKLKPLGERYRSTLETIGQKAAPAVQQWRQAGRQIVERWKNTNPGMADKVDKIIAKRMQFFGLSDEGMRKKVAAARFMLWDGSENFMDNNNESEDLDEGYLFPGNNGMQQNGAERFGLGNYPNPFTSSTMISFVLPTATHVKLSVLDATGRLIALLADQNMNSGAHSYPFNLGNDNSGTYICRLETAGSKTEHMMSCIR
jgi:hypothetical protein